MGCLTSRFIKQDQLAGAVVEVNHNVEFLSEFELKFTE